MASRMDTRRRHHIQRGRSVGAMIAGTVAQTWRKDKADGGQDRLCLQDAQQNIPRYAVFGSDPRRCGGCDRCAHRSQQRVWKHVETMRAGSCADTLPTDAGKIVHAVGMRQYHSMAAISGRVDRVERGARHVARRGGRQSHFFASRTPPSVAGNNEGSRRRLDRTTRHEGRLVI